MRIAVFSDIYAPGGTGGIVSSIRAQKAELEKQGHTVVVFCPGHQTKEKNVILVPTHPKMTINGAAVAMRPSLIEAFILEQCPDFEKFDVVHIHYEASCSIAGVRLAKRFNIPLVQTMHGREDLAIAMNIARPLRLIVATTLVGLHRKCLPHTVKVKKDKFLAPTHTRAKMWQLMVNQAEAADVVTTPAEHMAKKLEHYGVSRPIVAIPNGVTEEIVGRDFRERKLEDGDVLKMLWPSRLSGEKRILSFLRALTLLKRPYMVYVFGDGNMEKKARKYAEAHQLKVKFFGSVPREKMLGKMAEAHLSVLASYNFDTQGMTLIEAEAAGLPVFIADPTLMEVVPRGGFILSGGPEAEAMAIALENLDSKKIGEMSRKMLAERAKVAQSVQTKKMIAVYRLAQQEHKKAAS